MTILAKGRKIAEGTLEELRELSQSEGQTLEEVFLKLTVEKHEAPAVFEL